MTSHLHSPPRRFRNPVSLLSRAALLALLGLLSKKAQAQIFVTNEDPYSIDAYAVSGSPLGAPLVSGPVSYGIAVSGSDVFISDFANGTIGEYTMSGAVVNASLISGLGEPMSLAVSGPDLFVQNVLTGTIGEYTTSGAVVNASLISDPDEGLAGGIAVSGSHIFVANPGPLLGDPTLGGGTISEYTATGALVTASLISGLNDPQGLAASGSDLFVTTLDGTVGGGAVAEYTTTGAKVDASLVSGLDLPEGVAVSGPDLFVTDSWAGTIGEYTTSGATVDASLVSGMGEPWAIAVAGGAAPAGVPEPASTWALLGVTAAGLFCLRRRIEVSPI